MHERIQSRKVPLRSPSTGATPTTVELCAGCARLSFSLSSKGFTAFAVDHSKNRHAQLHPCMMCDLADDSSVDQLLSILEGSGLLTYFHAAPPCGTCSRARERKNRRRLRRRGAPEPVPLRSTRFPDGLPNLPRGQQRRVDTANRVYRNVARILRWAINKGCIVSIENPTRSHIWSTKYIKALIED